MCWPLSLHKKNKEREGAGLSQIGEEREPGKGEGRLRLNFHLPGQGEVRHRLNFLLPGQGEGRLRLNFLLAGNPFIDKRKEERKGGGKVPPFRAQKEKGSEVSGSHPSIITLPVAAGKAGHPRAGSISRRALRESHRG